MSENDFALSALLPGRDKRVQMNPHQTQTAGLQGIQPLCDTLFFDFCIMQHGSSLRFGGQGLLKGLAFPRQTLGLLQQVSKQHREISKAY